MEIWGKFSYTVGETDIRKLRYQVGRYYFFRMQFVPSYRDNYRHLSKSQLNQGGVRKLFKKNETRPVEWAFWNPGLSNDEKTLGEVYKTLPTHEFTSYPLIVLFVENPKSPFALKGKCDLLTHDLIHVLLGRGLYVQDEAFVIGYTMGTSRKIGGFEKEVFKFFAHRLYPKKYRFRKEDLFVFDLGFAAGQANKIDLFDKDLKSMLNISLGELRSSLGISAPLLRHLYAVEQKVIHTKASERIYNRPVFGE